jgi:hypothetical protein
MALVLFLGMAEPGQGQPTYTVTTFDPPGSLFPGVFYATAINDSGQIVGSSDTGSNLLLDHGSYTTLDLRGQEAEPRSPEEA